LRARGIMGGSDSDDDKKKKKRKHEESSSDSDSSDEKDKKSKKSKKEKKSKKDKKSKKSHKEPKQSGEVPQITEADYFAKNPEFRVWLSDKQGKAFGDLTDADARSRFKKFLKKWNAGDLKDKYYKGITYSELPSNARTTHAWGFAKKVKGSFELDSVKDKIHFDTQNATLLGGKPLDSNEIIEDARERASAQLKLDRKKDRQQQKADGEELAPKADPGSFQARMEKRAQKGHYCREKDGDMGMEIKDSDLMGGNDSLKAKLDREGDWKKAKQAAKNAEGQAKLEAHNVKERAKMNEFRKMMGLPLEGE